MSRADWIEVLRSAREASLASQGMAQAVGAEDLDLAEKRLDQLADVVETAREDLDELKDAEGSS